MSVTVGLMLLDSRSMVVMRKLPPADDGGDHWVPPVYGEMIEADGGDPRTAILRLAALGGPEFVAELSRMDLEPLAEGGEEILFLGWCGPDGVHGLRYDAAHAAVTMGKCYLGVFSHRMLSRASAVEDAAEEVTDTNGSRFFRRHLNLLRDLLGNDEEE